MKLWKIHQSENNDYDTYDSAVVVAETEDDAKLIHPSEHLSWNFENMRWQYSNDQSEGYHGVWTTPDKIRVDYIGEASDELKAGEVIVASFNAG